ncbi:MAG TPA: chromate transporter [Stellaceae bacterium]|nr:chromate transporter [Stellaceae bacterium]
MKLPDLSDVHPVAEPPEVTLGGLYLAFMQVGLSGFGGALAWTRRKFVEQRRWLSDEEFAEALSLCQFLPGPNVINLAVFIGLRFQDTIGAAVAVAGVVLVPFVVVVALGALYTQFGQIEMIHGALAGISAAAAGLIVSMGLKMAMLYRKRRPALIFGALAFVGVGLVQWPLPLVLACLAPTSVGVAWLAWRRRR